MKLNIHPQGYATLASFDSLNSQIISGISTKKFGSISLGIKGVDREQVLKNRESFLSTLGLLPTQLTMAEQLHTTNIHIVTKKDEGAGCNSEETLIPNTDGLVSNIPGICLGVRVADCVPILYFDPKRVIIAAVHAGWKGTLGRISAQTVEIMKSNFGSSGADIRVGFGPSIGPCCYEIKEDVSSQIEKEFPGHPEILLYREGKIFLDLWTANRLQLEEAGVLSENIESTNVYTKDNTDTFFSYRDRMQGGKAGLFIAVISIKK